jgi:hypothetical protein
MRFVGIANSRLPLSSLTPSTQPGSLSMPLYTMTNEAITPVQETSFGAAGVHERADMQRLLKANVGLISPDTLIVSEEFGSWDASYRRIDLLGVDRDGNLVVIELKRDDTGAHMELQALRYAAMVARMTFEQAVETYRVFLGATHPPEDARTALLKFLGLEEPNESSFAQDVRVVLVAADFSKELTTSVMWLNERDLDIRCVQLKPYRLGEQLLLDVQQVIPLREASDYQVQVREKARRERAASTGSADWTRYDLTIGGNTYSRLPKRRFIYLVVRHVIEQMGHTPGEIEAIVDSSRPWAWLEGDHNAESFRAGIEALAKNGGPRIDPLRFFSDDADLIRVNGRTFAFTKMWGTATIPSVQALQLAYPKLDLNYKASEDT